MIVLLWGNGHWDFFIDMLTFKLKFSFSSPTPQVYYKAVRDIEAGEELLVYMKDGIFPEGSMAPNLQGKINARH